MTDRAFHLEQVAAKAVELELLDQADRERYVTPTTSPN